MSTNALLAAVIATPDDDLVRLVYADYVEENGDAERAELIRVQCELAKLPDWDGRCLPLKHRQRVLLARNGRRWHAELPQLEGVSWGEFHRGFVRTVLVQDVKALTGNAEEVAAATPLDGVTLQAWPTRNFRATPLPWLNRMSFTQRYEFQAQHLERVLESPLAAHLTDLDLGGVGVENAGAAVVARMRHLKLLKSIDFSNCFIGVAGATALAGADHLKSLTRLEFSSYGSGYVDDPFVSEAGIEAIATSPRFRHLTHLGLGGNGMTTRSIQQLLASKTLANLKSVVLAQAERIEAAAFAETDGPARWTELNISMCWEAGRGFLAAVARSPQLEGLVRLRMSNTTADAEGVQAISDSPISRTLRHLDLKGCSVNTAAVEHLAEAKWPHLHTLKLSGNKIGPAGVKALAGSKGFPSLAVLDLGGCDVTDAGVRAVATATWAKTLLRLNLSTDTQAYFMPNRQGQDANRTIGASGARAIADSKALRGLTELDLNGNQLGADGARAIAAADFPHLTDLDLSQSDGGDAMAEALAASGKMATLLTLGLNAAKLTSVGVARLSEEDAPGLGSLGLSNNAVADAGAVALAAAGWTSLRYLQMSQCEVKAEGMTALATAPFFERLTYVNYYGNTVPTNGPAAKKFQRNVRPDIRHDPTWLPVEEPDVSDGY